jgi:hypothetical protein
MFGPAQGPRVNYYKRSYNRSRALGTEPMGPLHAIQTAESLFVLTVIALAESSALLLARFPSVELLWYLNQDVFRFMETGRQFLPSPSVLFLSPATLYWDLGLIVVTLLVYRLRWRFGVAVISHVCLIFTAILTYVWVADRNLPKTVSLDPGWSIFAAKWRSHSLDGRSSFARRDFSPTLHIS